jgi:hypothetical protein
MSTKRTLLHLNSFFLAIVEKPAMVAFFDDNEVLPCWLKDPFSPLPATSPSRRAVLP